jgi:hypothetical protein
VKPGDVAGRDLEVENPDRSVLEDLAMMRFLVDRHDRRLGRRRGGLLREACGGEEDSGANDGKG